MHIHILGICGTFMGGVALLARAAGHTVTGCDANVYPPMSTQLEEQGIGLIEGYDTSQLDLEPDMYVVGNAVSRGNPLLEAILDRGLPYVSGPQWLAEHVLAGRWVLAVAGTTVTAQPAAARRVACMASSSAMRSVGGGETWGLPSTPATITGRGAASAASRARSTAQPVSAAERKGMPICARARGRVSAVRAQSTSTPQRISWW